MLQLRIHYFYISIIFYYLLINISRYAIIKIYKGN
jgi:hypothetical protein